MRTGNTLGNRILALALSVLMVLGMLPAGAVFADTSAYATVTALSEGVTIEGSGTENVSATYSGTLNWVAKDTAIGRDQDGWWVGIQVVAPETLDMELAQYQSGGAVRKFADFKDSADDADEHYIGLWGLVKPEYLISANQTDGLATYTYKFDWDGDGVYEQTVLLNIDAAKTVLNQDGASVYPYAPVGLGTVSMLTAGGSLATDAEQTTATYQSITLQWAAADPSVGRMSDGWWVGLKVSADEALTTEADFAGVTYQSYNGDTDTWSAAKSYWDAQDSDKAAADTLRFLTVWGCVSPELISADDDGVLEYKWRFDWNADGIYEQTVCIRIVTEDVILRKNASQVYPVLKGVVEALTAGTVTQGENATIWVSNAELQWHPADASVGRMEDGWWVGSKITAPEGMTVEADFENVTYQSYNGETDTWSAAKNFWNAQDSDKNEADTARFLTMWGLVTPEKIAADSDGILEYKWRFDWNCDGTYEQTLTVSVDTTTLKLMNGTKQEYPVYFGEVIALTGGTVTGSQTENTVVLVDNGTLQWHEKDLSIGRNQDGWWVGLQVNAPAHMTTAADFENVTYQVYSNSNEAWSEAASFWDSQDSDKNVADTARFLSMWGCLTPEKIAADDDGVLTYKLRIDWNADGYYDQVVTLQIEPENITLLKDGVQHYPLLGHVSTYTGGEVVGSGTSEVTVTITEGTLDWTNVNGVRGWWVGIRVNAPEDALASVLQNAQYQVKNGPTSEWSANKSFWANKDSADSDASHNIQLWFPINEDSLAQFKGEGRNITMWYRFDWDGDGVFDQNITFSVDPNGTYNLKKAEQSEFDLVGQKDASSNEITNVVYNDNGNVYNFTTVGVLSDNGVKFEIISGDAATVSADGKLTILKAGTVTVKATALEDAFYHENSDTFTLTIALAPQQIVLPNSGADTVLYGTESYQIIPSMDGLCSEDPACALQYAIESDEVGATVGSDGTVTFDHSKAKVGTVVVKVTKPGDACYSEDVDYFTLKVEYLQVSQPATHSGDKTDSASIWYTGNVKIIAPVGYTICTDNTFQGTGVWAESFAYDVQGGNQTVDYYLKDADGHMTDKMQLTGIYLDTTKPTASISYSKDVWQRAVELLSFGFYQANVDVTFTAADAVSGLSYITFSLDKGVTYVTVNAADMVYDAGTGTYSKTITIEAPFDSWITCTATDNAGILSDEAYGSGTNLVVDKTAPSWIEPEYTNIVKTTDEILYATQDVSVKLAIMDTNFDLSLLGLDDLQSAAPVVTVNGTVVDGLVWAENTGVANQYETSFQITSGEGDYVLEVSYADRSKNEMVSYTKTIHVDATAPKIVFEDAKLAATCTNEDLSTVITVTDHNFNPETTVVYLSAVDKNGAVTAAKAPVTVTWVQDTTDQDVWTAVVAPISGDGIYLLEVESTDMALNFAKAASKNFIVDKTVPASVEISYAEPVKVFDRVLDMLTFGKYYTYGEKVEVTIKANDPVSGVKAFAWTYTRDDGVSVTNVAAKNDEIVYTEDGAIAQVTFVLTASEAEQFRGSVTVTVTDMAGNFVEVSDAEKVGVVVDSVKPVIKVTYSEADRVVDAATNKDIASYDFSSNNANAVLYYSDKVEATIEITEANFDLSKDVKILDGEKALTVTDWTQMKDENGALTDTWTATVVLSEEGRHQLTISYTDPANNVMQSYTSEQIVIDATNPVAKIDFAGAEIVNTIDGINYYADTVMATVTIQETNFRAEDVKFLLTYKDVTGAEITAAETRSAWKSEGDVHTITLVFDKDANYTLDVEYTDLAMRASNDVTTEAFTVDKTVPVKPGVKYSQNLGNAILHNITFGYYNGKVTVTVTVEDTIAGIDTIDFEYILNEGVSKVNKGGSGTVETKRDGSTFTASFEVPAEALTKNNQFNGYVRFTATDRSGKSIQFTDEANALVVDSITPNVQISYNAPVKTAGDIAYYAGNIFATIQVEEANFFSKDVRVSVEKDGVAYPVEVTWITNYVGNYTGTFQLTEDGDYQVKVNYTDRSNNSMAPYTSGTLTLDTKAPELAVTNVVNNSANADKVYTFQITASDINADPATFAPKLIAIVQLEDGTFTTKEIDLGAVQTVEEGKSYTFEVKNLEEDAIYQLTAVAADMSGNTTNKMLLADGKTYEKVTFSINRNGSTFSLDEYTLGLVQTYYTQNVTQDLVIFEINVDTLQECEVALNGTKLIADVDYKITAEGGDGSWMKYTYTVNKDLFAGEGEYKLVISSKDAAGNDAFSDVKDAEIDFIVDRTAPVVSVTGMTENGRYQVESQTVTLVPMDDGGLLNSLAVTMVDNNGEVLKEVLKLEGQQLWDALESGDGKITFEIGSGLYQNVRVVCTDSAANAEGSCNTYDETVRNISVSSSGFMIFWANTGLRYGVIAGVLAVAAGAVALLLKKKKK